MVLRQNDMFKGFCWIYYQGDQKKEINAEYSTKTIYIRATKSILNRKLANIYLYFLVYDEFRE